MAGRLRSLAALGVLVAASTGAVVTPLATGAGAPAPVAGGVVGVVPARVFDSRVGGVTVDGLFAGVGRVGAGRVVPVRVAGRGGVVGGASAVVLNVTAVGASAAGFLSVFPCVGGGVGGGGRPLASSVNFVAGGVVANAVFVGVGDGGRVCVFASAEVDVVVDVTAEVRPAQPVAPPTSSTSTSSTTPPTPTTLPVPGSTSTTLASGPVTTVPPPPTTTTTTPTPSTTTTTTTTTITTVPPVGPAWRLWVTSPTDPDLRLAEVTPSAGAATDVVDAQAPAAGATWLGVGAALTDSSVALLAERPDLRAQLYGPGQAGGAQLNLVRLPLSATDFSTVWWSWTWNGALGRWVPPAQAVAAADTAADLAAIQPTLSIMGVPWSAPAVMKTSASIAGGALAAGQEDDLAALLGDQVAWMVGRSLPIDALALVNEPGHSGNYPTMTMTDSQLATVGALLHEDLAAAGVELWAVDHNWNDRSRMDHVLALAPGVFDRGAFHCYGGSPAQMAGLPVPAVVTECTGTTDGWTNTFRWDAANLVMGSLAAGSTGLMMWNLALDTDHGPKRSGGCTNCRGLLTVDPSTGSAAPTPEYFALAHLARAADPGAQIGAVQYSGPVTSATFANEGGELGVIGFNDSSLTRTVMVRTDGGSVTVDVPPWSYFSARRDDG